MNPGYIATATRAQIEALIGTEATARFTVMQTVDFVVLAGQSKGAALAAILTTASGRTVTAADATAALQNRNSRT